MELEYIYYSTDESFDYGDWPGSTCYEVGKHGFSIEFSDNDVPLLNTIEGFGNLCDIENHKNDPEKLCAWLKESKERIGGKYLGPYGGVLSKYKHIEDKDIDELIELIENLGTERMVA